VLPLLLALFERFPLTRNNYRTRIPTYLAAMVGISLVQIVLMWTSRSIVYLALGWGSYDYGDLRYVLPMEFLHALPAYVGVLGVHALARSVARQRQRDLAVVELEKELSEARLRQLESQLQPHFLFNALNTIRTYVHEDADAADRTLGHLADFLRLALRHSEAHEVTLATELQLLDAYVAIMKARFESRLSVDVEVEPGAAEALVPHLLLQPLVENAVRHALDRPGAARITVRGRRDSDALTLRIWDSGRGKGASTVAGLGVGLSNTARRLELLYGAAARLRSGDAEGGGFEVAIELPIRWNES
jgi:LytS/YehU family sensor histidine kinase